MNYKYRKVINFIYDNIANNNIEPSKKLPSERKLSETLKVSRTTVKYAIDMLVKDKILYKVHGKGTFMRSHKNKSIILVDKNNPDAFHSNVQSKGLLTSNKVISFKVLYDHQDLNHIFKEVKDFYELIRVRYIQNEPSSIEYCYFPFKMFSDANRHDFSKNSLYEYMKSKNKNPVTFLKSIEVISDKAINDKLIMDCKTPLFHQTYYGRDSNGILVEYTESYSSTQNMEFGFEVNI